MCALCDCIGNTQRIYLYVIYCQKYIPIKNTYRGSSHSADSHSVVLSIVRFLKLFRNIHIVWIPLYSVVWENIYSGVIKLDLFSPRYGQTQGYNLYNYLVLKHM